jgi:hypothetical protein
MTGLVDYLTDNCCAASGGRCDTACATSAASKSTRRKRVA